MSVSHKAALAEGREQGRKVRRYLEALEAHKPRRGRKRTPDSIRKRLAAIQTELESADALKRVQLVQERLDLQNELQATVQKVDLATIERDFVQVAKGYGSRKGLTYAAWREVGVAPSVLKKAGISRGST